MARSNEMLGRRHRVAIVGAGFGGLFAARALRRADVEVTVIDRTNHHLFQPLLYQVATGARSNPEPALAGRPGPDRQAKTHGRLLARRTITLPRHGNRWGKKVNGQ
jgi:NADH dehydrogenase